jgi:hypothetical protein
MKRERDRLKRMQRLERVRAIAKQTAVAEAAQAETVLAQLQALAEKTRVMAAEYAGRSTSPDGADLSQIGRFALGLQGISTNTANDAAGARRMADAKMIALSQAERRRAVVEDRAARQARVIAKGSDAPVLTARKGFGTTLD